jgi:acyl-CoA thioester hydrolase
MPKNENIDEILASCHEVISAPVVWGEMDAFGHLNNIYFFRYFENCRISFFDKMGFTKFGTLSRIGPILAETSCRYKAPIAFPDTLRIGGKVVEIGRDRFKMELLLVSEKLQRTAAVGEALVVCYDYEEGHKIDMPQEWAGKLSTLLNPA